MTLPPLVENPILTIHMAAPHPENLDALVPDLLSESAANLIQESLCNGDSMVVVSKSYRSDPNHTLGALASSIPDSERIISLCPATRLKLTQPQALSFNAPDGQTSMENLLSHALSIKPDYIVLGDHCSNTSSIKQIRAAGHSAFLASIYASDVAEATEMLRGSGALQADYLIFQENDTKGETVISAIYQHRDDQYEVLFERSEDGTLEASA